MATYSKGCSAVGGYSYASNFTLYIELTETDVNVSNNTSKIKYKVYCKSNGSGSISARHYEYFKLNGQTIIDETVNVSASSPNANIAIASGTTSAITHNSDGTKSVSFEAEIEASSYGVKASKSGTFTLSTIARKSSVSASAANIGANSTITINRASSAFTHTLTYTFGSLSGTIATKTSSTSVSWTLPDNFYSQIPNSQSGTGTITCTTYNGNTSLGSNTCSFTAKAVYSAASPTVTATVTDVNSTTTALTGNNQKLVLNASTARVVVSTTLRKNAGSIKYVRVNGISLGTSTSITRDFTNVTTSVFTIEVVDSREYVTTVTLRPTTVNYIPLTLNAQIFRPTPTSGEIDLKYNGNYFNGSFGSQSNTLTISYKYKETTSGSYITGDVPITPTISGNTYSRSQTNLGTSFTYTNAYNFTVTVTDKIKSITFSTTVNRGMPVFYWSKDFLRVNQAIRIPKNGTAGWGLCNASGVSIIRDHNNTNVTVDATGGTLFLGYQDTTSLNILNGKAFVESGGRFLSKNSDVAFVHTHSSTNRTMSFGVGGGGDNRGIYDGNSNYWVLYHNDAKTTTLQGSFIALNANTRVYGYLDVNTNIRSYSGNIWTDTGNVYCNTADASGKGCRMNGSNGNLTVCGSVYDDYGSMRFKHIYDADNVTNATNMYITSGGWIRRTTNTSLLAHKTDIKNVESDVLNPERLYDLEVKQFKYKKEYQPSEYDIRYQKDLIGFIAEDVEKVYPIAVDYEYDIDHNDDESVNDIKDDPKEVKKSLINWNERYFIPPMLKLIQDHKQKIDELEKRIKILEEYIKKEEH